MTPRIVLLNCSRNLDDAHRNFRRELDAAVTEFRVTDGEFPSGDRPVDAVVVSGSRSSVLDDDEWIDETEEWVGDAVRRGVPVLGVCFGHQLLATALGGTVESMASYEVGFKDVRRHETSRLFDGVDKEFTAFSFHSDEVTDLPDDAVRLAGNDRCAVQAFRHGHAFGVQFHPEFDSHTVKKALEYRDVRPGRIQEVLESLAADIREFTQVKQVFRNFTDYVLDRQDASHLGRAGARA